MNEKDQISVPLFKGGLRGILFKEEESKKGESEEGKGVVFKVIVPVE